MLRTCRWRGSKGARRYTPTSLRRDLDLAVADVGVAQRHLQLLVAEQPRDHWQRVSGFMAREYRGQAADLRCRQNPLPPLSAVALDALAGIPVFRSIAIDLGLAHDDRQDRRRAVRCHGRCVTGYKPFLHLPAGDVRDLASPEPGQDLVPAIALVHRDRSRFPVPPVAPEHLLGDGLKDGLFRQDGRVLSCRIVASSAVARERASSAFMASALPTIFQMRRPRCWLWMK